MLVASSLLSGSTSALSGSILPPHQGPCCHRHQGPLPALAAVRVHSLPSPLLGSPPPRRCAQGPLPPHRRCRRGPSPSSVLVDVCINHCHHRRQGHPHLRRHRLPHCHPRHPHPRLHHLPRSVRHQPPLPPHPLHPLTAASKSF